jgi:hypothetical protein
MGAIITPTEGGMFYPDNTSLTPENKALVASLTVEYQTLGNTGGRNPIISMTKANFTYEQMLSMAVNIGATSPDAKLLWQATEDGGDIVKRARAVAMRCKAGAGVIFLTHKGIFGIPTGGNPYCSFPLGAGGFYFYMNTEDGPDYNDPAGGTDISSGDGIEGISILTEVQSSFELVIFI